MNNPNIILILADQMRYDTLGITGNPVIQTPHIDSLADSGWVFTRPYSCLPICMPQRVSLMTGQYPSAHGTVCNGIPYQGRYPMLPELLRDQGYQTFSSGKMHLNPIAEGFTEPLEEPGEVQGLPYMGFEGLYDVEGYTSAYLKRISNEAPELLEAANHRPGFTAEGPFQVCPTPIPLSLHRSTGIADHAISFIRGRDRSRPFFLHCSFWDPHHPFDPPDPYDRMYEPEDMPLPIPGCEEEFSSLPSHFQEWYTHSWGDAGKNFKEHSMQDWQKIYSQYYGMISLIDDSIGRLLQVLEEEGLQEDTIIIFTSDHGELLGDHGLALKGPFFYEGLLKVPLIIHDPRTLQGSMQTIDEPVMTYDIMPTIMEWCSGTVPPMTARSLVPFFMGDPREPDTILIEGEDTGMVCLVDGDWKIIVYRDLDQGQLYNLQDDPEERVNLWDRDYRQQSRMLQLVGRGLLELRPPAGLRSSRW